MIHLARKQAAPSLSLIADIIADVRAGKPVIMVDDESRENEGDLIIAADRITPELVNFMIRHCCGLVCMPMEGAMIDRLALPPMTQDNRAKFQTAFTVSIGAREGITTGISAADRSHTIKVAANPNSTQGDITVPGHIFPLRAKNGGVLERAGHTEAAVDLAKLAGLSGAGVICEIIRDDGTMARLPDLFAFGQTHDLRIGTIADLIAMRSRNA